MLEFYTDNNYEFSGFQLDWVVTNDACTLCDTGPRSLACMLTLPLIKLGEGK